MITDILAGVFVFIFGVIIGSFLNCVIYRLESKKSLMGRSFCPHCRHVLKWIDLFPILSFVFLGGKCRYCKKRISWQYPVVELATGIIFLLIFLVSLRASPQAGATIQGFFAMTVMFYVASALIVIFVYDLKFYLIPDKVLFPAIIITAVYRVFENYKLLIGNYGLAVLIGSGFFFSIWALSKGRAMGFGDVKFAILMGLLLGFPNILPALFLAFFAGAVISVFLMMAKKKELKSEVPFGPFLVFGTFLSMFWGNQIIQWYLNLFKI